MPEGGSLSLAQKAVARPQGACKLVLITAPKGGVGKTTLSRALLVAAAHAGLKVIGIDTDSRQLSLTGWAGDRKQTAEIEPSLTPVEVWNDDLSNWRSFLGRCASYDLAILDTPPGVKDAIPALHSLAQVADFTIIPTGSTADDLKQVLPWGKALTSLTTKVTFCMSAVDENTKVYRRSVGQVNKIANVIPMPIPRLQIIPEDSDAGLTVLDRSSESVPSKERKVLQKAQEAFETVWDVVRREVRI